jgi:hypothetical protein
VTFEVTTLTREMPARSASIKARQIESPSGVPGRGAWRIAVIEEDREREKGRALHQVMAIDR